jgi:hypothetical protein
MQLATTTPIAIIWALALFTAADAHNKADSAIQVFDTLVPPVNVKDGKPHNGPFVGRGRARNNLSSTVTIPESGDPPIIRDASISTDSPNQSESWLAGVADRPDVLRTEAGISAKEKLHMAHEEKFNKLPEAPDETSLLPHSERRRTEPHGDNNIGDSKQVDLQYPPNEMAITELRVYIAIYWTREGDQC